MPYQPKYREVVKRVPGHVGCFIIVRDEKAMTDTVITMNQEEYSRFMEHESKVEGAKADAYFKANPDHTVTQFLDSMGVPA